MINTGLNIDDIKLKSSTKFGDNPTLYKRARAKYFTSQLMIGVIAEDEKKKKVKGLVDLDSPLNKAYWNTYYCTSTLVHKDNKITGRYCKNRFCLVCNRIRTAINIKKYSDIVNSWTDEKYFVTLTLPNVSEEKLEKTIDDMLNSFVKITDIFRKRNIKFIGIRKIECTYNPKRNDYHPHFHCIIKGKEVSEILLKEWLIKYSEAKSFCQDVRQCNDKDVMEIFKYFTKIISSRYNGEKKSGIYIKALDKIFLAFRNRRTFQNYGFKANNIDEIREETVEVTEICDKIQYYEWESELSDWINKQTGELLTGYLPSEALKDIINNIQVEISNTS